LNTGDRSAFVVVYEQYYPLVVLFAKQFVGEAVAADITAEVFIRLWKQPKAFSSISHLKNSLQLTARNLCIDQLRAKQTEGKRQRELQYLESHVDPGDYHVEQVRAQVYERVLAEIDRLPAYLREVFRLAYVEGLNNAEIAKRLHLKDASVRTKKSQALDILRTNLSRIEFAMLMSYLLRHVHY
jgi:RNA polymerase sigma-70 factor (ECF subfamily)